MFRKGILVKNDKKKLQLTRQIPALVESKPVPQVNFSCSLKPSSKNLQGQSQLKQKQSFSISRKKIVSLKSNTCSRVLIGSQKKILRQPATNSPFIGQNEKENQEPKYENKNLDFLSKDKDLQNILVQFIKNLAQKPYQFSQRVNSYTFQKDYFINIFEYLILMFSDKLNSQMSKQFSKLKNLQQFYISIDQFRKKNKKDNLIDRQKINNGILNMIVNTESFQSQMSVKKQIIKNQQQEINNLAIKMKQISQKIETMESYNKIQKLVLNQKIKQNQQQQKKNQYLQQKRQQFQKKVEGLNLKIIQLIQSIQSKERILQQRIKQTQKIYTYVTQTSQMMKMVSQQYKEIQADIFDYACFLQGKASASSFQYDNFPFNQLIGELQRQYNILVKSINQSQDFRPKQQKLACLKDFLLKEAQIFKNKDLQGAKKVQYKTQCIQQFVSKMNKWLVSQEFKQQYLTKLRQQFYALSQKMKHSFTILQGQNICEGCCQKIGKSISETKSIFQKIEENYKREQSAYKINVSIF